MRIVPKITLVLAIAITAVLSVRAWMRVDRETDLFDTDMKRDHRVVGHVLRSSVAEVWTIDGPARAKSLIDAANGAEGGVRVHWLPGAGVAATPAGSEYELQQIDSSTHDLVSVFTIDQNRPELGRFEIRESLAERDRYVHGTVMSTIVNVVVLVGICGLLALLLNRWLVGIPMQALIHKARRTGSGDLAHPLQIRGRDELGELAEEMNAMCEQLARANASVVSEAQARVDALQQLRHADRLATVGRLAAGIAHELGTPVSIVSGHAQMIAEREVLGDKVLESARTIDDQAGRITRIVRQLLDFARSKGPEGTSANAFEIAKRCESLLLPMAEKRGVRLGVHGSSEKAHAAIDHESLQQVLTNLVVNAVQATPHGGTIEIRVDRVRSAPPDGPGYMEGEFVRLDVKDSGTGIAPDVLAHIFEPFFTTKEAGDGTGLGLSVVYGIVKDHAGWIAVASDVEKGSTFSVFIPVKSA